MSQKRNLFFGSDEAGAFSDNENFTVWTQTLLKCLQPPAHGRATNVLKLNMEFNRTVDCSKVEQRVLSRQGKRHTACKEVADELQLPVSLLHKAHFLLSSFPHP